MFIECSLNVSWFEAPQNASQINYVSLTSTVIEKIGHADRKVCDVSTGPFVNPNKA